jgi:hypothetical protein
MEKKESKKQILVRVNEIEQINVVIEAKVDSVLIPFSEDVYDLIRYCLVFKIKPFIDLTYITDNSNMIQIIEFLKKNSEIYDFGLFVDDINFYKILSKIIAPSRIIISPSLNIKNSQSFDLFSNESCVVISDELSLTEISNLSQKTAQKLGIKIEGDYDLRKINTKEVKLFLNWKKSLCDQLLFFKKNNFSLYFIDLVDINNHNLLLILQNYKKLIQIENESEKEEILEEIKVNSSIKRSFSFYNPKDKKDPTNNFKGVFLGIVKNKKLKLLHDLKKNDKILLKNRVSTISKIKYIFVDKKKVELAKKGQVINLDLNEFKNDAKVFIRNTTKEYIFKGKKKITFEIGLVKDKPLIITAKCDGLVVDYFGDTNSQVAKNKPITKDYFLTLFLRLNKTPFYVNEDDININLGENLIIPFSSINTAKKQIINLMIDKILEIKEIKECDGFNPIISTLKKKQTKKNKEIKPVFYLKVYKETDLNLAIQQGFETFILELYNKDLYKFVEVIKNNGKEFYLETPLNIYPKQVNDVIKLIQLFSPKGIIINDLGLVAQKFNCEKIINYTIPTFFPNINTKKRDNLSFCHVISKRDLFEEKTFKFRDDVIYYVYGKPIRYITRQKLEDKKIKLYNVNLVKDALNNDSVIFSRDQINHLNEINILKNKGIVNYFIDTKNAFEDLMADFKFIK